MEKVLLVDHHDSFIYNIVAWLQQHLVISILNIDEFNSLSPKEFNDYLKKNSITGIILSPGPKSPHDYPNSLNLEKTYPGPIFGVCLGFQMMLANRGHVLFAYTPPVHGKCTSITISHPLFSSVKMPIKVARYHSLGFNEVKQDQDIIAYEETNRLPMVYLNEHEKRLGFQFHPESFLTERSEELAQIIANWFKTNSDMRFINE